MAGFQVVPTNTLPPVASHQLGQPQMAQPLGESSAMTAMKQAARGWPSTDWDYIYAPPPPYAWSDAQESPYEAPAPQSASISTDGFLRLADGTDTLETLAGYPQDVLPHPQAMQTSVPPLEQTPISMPEYTPQPIPDMQAGIPDSTDWDDRLRTLSALTGGSSANSQGINARIAQMNRNIAQIQANRIKPQAQRQTTHAGQSSSGRSYTVQPGMSMQPTNVPGQTQLNLVQNQLRFNDPEYQRLYALRDAQARQALQTRGIPYEEALAAARMGVLLR